MQYQACREWGHTALCFRLFDNQRRHDLECVRYCEQWPRALDYEIVMAHRTKAHARYKRHMYRKVGIRFNSRLYQSAPIIITMLLDNGWTGFPVSYLTNGGPVGTQWSSNYYNHPGWAYGSKLVTRRAIYRTVTHPTARPVFLPSMRQWFEGRCHNLPVDAQRKVWNAFPGLKSLEFKSLNTRRKWTRKLGKHIQNMTFKVLKLDYQHTNLPGFGERPWFGLEWELIGVNEEDPTPYIELPGKLARRVDMKSDSSLEISVDSCDCGCDDCETCYGGGDRDSAAGVEMAFAPASFNEARKLARAVAGYLPWDRIVEKDVRSGVHVHVDVDAVNLDIMKKMFTGDLYDKHNINAQLFRKWAVRAPNEWCRPQISRDHTSAVNLSGCDGKTVEFRSFASRGRPHWGARCIEATAALVYWAKQTRSKNPTWKTFFKWTAQHQNTYNIFGPVAAQALKEVI